MFTFWTTSQLLNTHQKEEENNGKEGKKEEGREAYEKVFLFHFKKNTVDRISIQGWWVCSLLEPPLGACMDSEDNLDIILLLFFH